MTRPTSRRRGGHKGDLTSGSSTTLSPPPTSSRIEDAGDLTYQGEGLADEATDLHGNPEAEERELTAQLERVRKSNQTLRRMKRLEQLQRELDAETAEAQRLQSEEPPRRLTETPLTTPESREEEDTLTIAEQPVTPAIPPALQEWLELQKRIDERPKEPKGRAADPPVRYSAKDIRQYNTFTLHLENTFEQYFVTYKEDSAQISYASGFLDGIVLTRWAAEKRAGHIRTWDEYKRFLRGCIGSDRSLRLQVVDQLERAQMRTGQTVQRFVEYLDSLEDQIGPETDAARLQRLLSKLEPDIKSIVLQQGTDARTRAELIEQATRIQDGLLYKSRQKGHEKDSGEAPEQRRPRGRSNDKRRSRSPKESNRSPPRRRPRSPEDLRPPPRSRASGSNALPIHPRPGGPGGCYNCGSPEHLAQHYWIESAASPTVPISYPSLYL
jgi:hypothetical protein